MVISGMNVNYIYRPQARTVLFLPGWNAPLSAYAPLFDRLERAGFGVAAADMPAVGGTDAPALPLTLADYNSFVLDFCRETGLESAVLMCHSNGGRIAVSLLADENCPLKCEKAVFIDAAGVPAKKTARQKLSLAAYKVLKLLGTRAPAKYLFDELYERVRDSRSSADYRAASPVMKKTMSNLLLCDMRPLMPRIRAEVLLIWGEHDTATPLWQGQAMEALIPGSGLAVIKNAGHFPFADAPAQFYPVLDAFMKGAL